MSTLKFDTVIAEPCVQDTNVDPTTCEIPPPGGVTPPSTDDRCADPAFRAANPDICAGYPELILKPEVAITEVGKTIQYRTFVRTNGNENEVTLGLTYTLVDANIAIIESLHGLATGVGVGISTVAVQWQNLHAYAQIQVVQACASLVNQFFILIDDSKSMGQNFDPSFATKLDYAKATALKFAEHADLGKDFISVGKFDTAATTIQTASQNLTAILAAIGSVVLTTGKTNIKTGIQNAIAYLNTLTGVRVLIVLTDGEDTGDSPLAAAQAFKEAGGVVVVVGIRSWGIYFDEIYNLASSGFFLSAYAATDAAVQDTLVALKSYLCSGDCAPTPGTYPTARLNYTGFINWDVDGYVDLIGLDRWDIIPGHGLYVDLNGTVNIQPGIGLTPEPGDFPPVVPPGTLTSKTTFDFVAGTEYTFKIKVGQFLQSGLPPTVIQVPCNVTIGTLLSQSIIPSVTGFTEYTFTFTPGSNQSAKISIASGGVAGNIGVQIDDVFLATSADLANPILFDDFNNENLTEIPPAYYYYYNNACLTSPPGAQSSDPVPPTPSIVE